MGILDNIKNLYNNVDKKLGGYLPGGQTPDQVKNTPTPISIPSSDKFLPNPSGNAASNIGAIDAAAKAPASTGTSGSSNTSPRGQINDLSFASPNGGVTSYANNNNTYDQATGTYTNNAGQGFSQAEAPSGARIIPGSATTITENPNVPRQPSNTMSNTSNVVDSYKTQTGKYEYGFFTPEGQQERLKNTWDVFKLAANPFSDQGIQANINNPMLKKGTELFANNPYQAALIATGIANAYGLTTQMISKGEALASGAVLEGETAAVAGGARIGTTAIAGQAAVNTATTATKINLLKGLVTGKNAMWALGILGTYAFSTQMSLNERGDALLALQVQLGNAKKAGDREGAQEIYDMINDISKPSVINTLKIYAPIINYPIAAIQKLEATKLAADTIMKEADDEYAKQVASTMIESKYQSGTATQEEIDAYIKDNPYSAIATIEKNKQVQAAKDAEQANDPNSPYGTIDQYGNYVPSAYEIAKRKESSQYYDSLNGNTNTNTASQDVYQPPSSLNFGLLKTSGGYETVSKDTVNPQGTFVTDVNTISDYYFGIPYTQLSAQQKQLVDMMK